MGSVWEGVHATLGTRVACKFIEAEFANSGEARDRFENEARAAAALRSKHVVDVYDHGVMADGRPYIVMEFLEGEPLDARLERQGRLSVAETADILRQVARALAKAHAVGVVHRDLKPENVFLVWDDEDQADVAKVVDFGIAKFTDDSMGISSQTRTGSVLGTPYYMSPEQARGLRSLDARSDLWSLGVIAYQSLTGRLPFTGEAVGDLLVTICTQDPAPPCSVEPSLPPDVDAWMAKALCRDPEGRFDSAKAMAQALLQIAGNPRAPQASSWEDRSSAAAMAGTMQASQEMLGTQGALTNAAVETQARIPTTSNKGLFAAIAVGGVALLVGVAVFAVGGGGDSDVTAGAASSEPPAAATQPAGDDQPSVEELPPAEEEPKTEPSAKAEAEPESESEAEPEPEPAATARPEPRPAPAPRRVAPRPQPRPEPVRPAPRPSRSEIDLGY